MDKYKCLKILPDDEMYISIIASWYFHEWGIAEADTIDRIKGLGTDNEEFQVLLTLGGKPIATGGLYNHVGLLNKLPHLKIHKHWLALVYTIPEYRGNGAGSAICMEIEKMAGDLGCSVIYLFTHTAENLYQRLGWKTVQRLILADKNIAIMKRDVL